jgi:mannose-6-phosphate isomerase-like protein (cupin superfamily)
MEHPTPILPIDHALFTPEKMAKVTLFASDHMLVGLNCFEPGQEHALHGHADMDKVYSVVSGNGTFLLEGIESPMGIGMLLVAPAGVPHGIRNDSEGRLTVLAILAPGPKPK